MYLNLMLVAVVGCIMILIVYVWCLSWCEGDQIDECEDLDRVDH